MRICWSSTVLFEFQQDHDWEDQTTELTLHCLDSSSRVSAQAAILELYVPAPLSQRKVTIDNFADLALQSRILGSRP